MRRLIPFLLVGLTSCAPAHAGLSAGSSRLGRAGSLMEYLASANFVYNFSGTLTESAILTGSGSLTKLGTGTLTLTGNNSYTGPTTISAGVIVVGNDSALGTSAVTVGASGLLQLSGAAVAGSTLSLSGGSNPTFQTISGANTWAGAITLPANPTTRISADAGTSLTISGPIELSPTASDQLVLQGDGSISVSGVISGPAMVTRSATGVGTLTLSGANTYTAKTSVNGGTLFVSSLNRVASGYASSNLGAPTTAANGTINVGTTTTTGAITYTGSGETTDRVLNLAGTSGGLTLDQSGAGLLKFTSSPTATGAGSKTLTLKGSTAGTGELAGAIPNNNSTNKTSVTKDGTGTWTLSGTNTYTGATTIAAGTLTCANIPNTSTITFVSTATLNVTGTLNTSGTINASGGNGIVEKIVYTGAGETTGRAITLTSGGAGSNFTIDQSGSSGLLKFTGTVSRAAANTCALILQGSTAGTGELAGVISASSGAVPITKLGTGTWTLSGANTIPNGVTITGGTLIAANASGLGTGGVSIGAAGSLTVAVATLNTGAVAVASSGSRITFESAAAVVNKINVTGTVALGGCGLIFPAGVTTNGTYDLIVASGTMSGTMPTIVTNSTGKTLTLQQTGNTLQVVVSG